MPIVHVKFRVEFTACFTITMRIAYAPWSWK